MERLSRILSRLVLPGPGPLQQQRIQAAIGELLGEDAARGVRAPLVQKRRVVLEVASAAQAFEWEAFQKGRLLERLRAIEGLEGLEELRIRVGSWRNEG